LRQEKSAVEYHFVRGELQDPELALRNLHKTCEQKTKISANIIDGLKNALVFINGASAHDIMRKCNIDLIAVYL
jgi:hypothetical protein